MFNPALPFIAIYLLFLAVGGYVIFLTIKVLQLSIKALQKYIDQN